MNNPIFVVSIAGTLLVSAFTVAMKVASKEGYKNIKYSFFDCKFEAKK